MNIYITFVRRKNNLKKYSKLKCILIGERNGTVGMKIKSIIRWEGIWQVLVECKENRDERIKGKLRAFENRVEIQ